MLAQTSVNIYNDYDSATTYLGCALCRPWMLNGKEYRQALALYWALWLSRVVTFFGCAGCLISIYQITCHYNSVSVNTTWQTGVQRNTERWRMIRGLDYSVKFLQKYMLVNRDFFNTVSVWLAAVPTNQIPGMKLYVNWHGFLTWEFLSNWATGW